MIENEIQEVIDMLKDHGNRICALENTQKKKNNVTGEEKKNQNQKNYSGPKGGVLLLLDRGFFKDRKTVDDVHNALEKEKFIYKKDVARTTLNRLANSKGPLVKINENGKKFYAQRK
jgi:hypothetical protein